MNKYRFYIGWFTGSDSNCGGENGVNGPEDLPAAFENEKSEGIDMYEIEDKNDRTAYLKGILKAFDANFTRHDSCSCLMKLTDDGWKII
jgi:hypothetical protein